MFPHHRIEAAKIALSWVQESPLILDTETTGLGSSDQVVEIAVIDMDRNVLLDTLVRPSCPVSSQAAAIHGIREADLAGAPSIERVWPRLGDLLSGRLLLLYNAAFDMRLLGQSLCAAGIPANRLLVQRTGCVMELYARYYGAWNTQRRSYRWQSLESALHDCQGSPVGPAHRALSDALATRHVVRYMAQEAAACDDAGVSVETVLP